VFFAITTMAMSIVNTRVAKSAKTIVRKSVKIEKPCDSRYSEEMRAMRERPEAIGWRTRTTSSAFWTIVTTLCETPTSAAKFAGTSYPRCGPMHSPLFSRGVGGFSAL